MMRDTEEREGCRLITLARSSVAHVQRCVYCGALALHLGPVTLRFDRAALESVWTVLGRALAQADLESEPLPSTPRHARPGQA